MSFPVSPQGNPAVAPAESRGLGDGAGLLPRPQGPAQRQRRQGPRGPPWPGTRQLQLHHVGMGTAGGVWEVRAGGPARSGRLSPHTLPSLPWASTPVPAPGPGGPSVPGCMLRTLVPGAPATWRLCPGNPDLQTGPPPPAGLRVWRSLHGPTLSEPGQGVPYVPSSDSRSPVEAARGPRVRQLPVLLALGRCPLTSAARALGPRWGRRFVFCGFWAARLLHSHTQGTCPLEVLLRVTDAGQAGAPQSHALRPLRRGRSTSRDGEGTLQGATLLPPRPLTCGLASH